MGDCYSVLMSVYHKEKPENLRQSIHSMLTQTVPPGDFVIVCDGPLNDGLDAVLADFQAQYPELFQIIRMPENRGVGAAMKLGIGRCRYEIIAKMDADDISLPQRCQRQLERFAANPALTVVGCYIREFTQDPEKPCTRRVVPCDNESIRRFARRRIPINNMTAMYRKSAVLAVGGFQEYTRCEDYDLYVRMLHAGYQFENIPEDLMLARIADGASDRRVSPATYKGFLRTRWNAYRLGYSSLADLIIACGAETAVFVSPRFLQQWIYRKALRKPVIQEDAPEGVG